MNPGLMQIPQRTLPPSKSLGLVWMTYRGHVGIAWWEENSRDWQGKVTNVPASCLAIFAGRSLEEAEFQFHELVDAFVEEEP